MAFTKVNMLSFVTLQIHSSDLEKRRSTTTNKKRQIERIGARGEISPSYSGVFFASYRACVFCHLTCWFQSLISVLLLYPNRENYVFLQVGFQHLAYEKREDIASYGLESLLGKSNTDINNNSTQ